MFAAISCVKGNHVENADKTDTNSTVVYNCYILKPVANDSKKDWYKTIGVDREISEKMLNDIVAHKKVLTIDTTYECITSFENQKEILINSHCLDKLFNADSSLLNDIYYNSIYRTKTYLGRPHPVHFIKSYTKNIFQYGNATIFEYSFPSSAILSEPLFLYLIIRVEDNSYGEDYKGYAISSDGMEWRDINYADSVSIPLFIKKTRTKNVFIPLIFDNNRFIPIGVLKVIDN